MNVNVTIVFKFTFITRVFPPFLIIHIFIVLFYMSFIPICYVYLLFIMIYVGQKIIWANMFRSIVVKCIPTLNKVYLILSILSEVILVKGIMVTVFLNCWNISTKKHDVQLTVKALGPLVKWYWKLWFQTDNLLRTFLCILYLNIFCMV